MQKGLAPILIVLLIAALVGGYVLYSKQKLSTAPSPQSIPSASSSAETANWKTYTNTRYGYSLKYPSKWESLECDSKGHLFAIFGPDVAPSCGNDSPGALIITVTDEVKDPLISVSNEFKVVEKKTITIDGKNGEWVYVEKVKPSPGADKIIVAAVVYAGKTYTFNLSNTSEQENLSKILSTFKFLDQNQISDTATWKTYTNTKYGYSLRYPSDWEVKMGVSGLSGDDSKLETVYQIKLNSTTIPEEKLTVWVDAGKSSDTIDEFSTNLGKTKTGANIMQIYSKEKTTLNGVEALKYVNSQTGVGQVMNVLIIKNGNAVRLTLEHPDTQPQNIPVFNEILSTFKFTN